MCVPAFFLKPSVTEKVWWVAVVVVVEVSTDFKGMDFGTGNMFGIKGRILLQEMATFFKPLFPKLIQFLKKVMIG